MSDERKPTLVIVGGERRGRGRPPVPEPRNASLTVWLRPSEQDHIVRLAIKHDVSMSAIVRALLFRPR